MTNKNTWVGTGYTTSDLHLLVNEVTNPDFKKEILAEILRRESRKQALLSQFTNYAK